MYDPQEAALDFEIGAFGDRLKKFGKKVVRGVGKFTDYTIVKPSAAIGGMIGGKKGRAFGRKLGKITQKVTHLGLAAGAAGAAPTLATAVGAGMIGKKLKKKLTKHKTKRAHHFGPKRKRKAKKVITAKKPKCDNAEAAKIGALLTKSLGGPLGQANKALQLAALQRKATAEHNRLMADAEFRKKVLQGITNLAADGNTSCERTIRVIMAR